MNKIKYILWDIDGTLLNFELAEKAALAKCFQDFNIGACTEEMLTQYKLINRQYWTRLELGEINKHEVLTGRFHDFFDMYDIDTSIAAKFNESYQIYLGNEAYFNPNGKEMVEAFKLKYQQYATTNGTKVAQEGKLSRSGLNELLDGAFISEKVGYEKPQIEYFDRVFQSIGSYNMDEYLIVGDSLTSDIQGGNTAGIHTCWFNPSDSTNETKLRVDYEIKDLQELLAILL